MNYFAKICITVIIDIPEDLMNNKTDFVIEDGVLIKYLGNDSEVVIPSGITSIGRDAFKKRDFDNPEPGTLTSVISSI